MLAWCRNVIQGLFTCFNDAGVVATTPVLAGGAGEVNSSQHQFNAAARASPDSRGGGRVNPIPHPNERQYKNEQNALVLNEPYLQSQPGLKFLLGNDEADIIQQVVFWRNHPYKDQLLDLEFKFKRFENRLWVRIPPGLMFNPWSGKLRHINRRTFESKLDSCRKQGVLWTANLNNRAGDKVNWYCIIDEVLNPLTGLYQEMLNQVQHERWEAKLRDDVLGDTREQQLMEECERRVEELRRKFKEDGWTPGKHFSHKDVAKIIAQGTYPQITGSPTQVNNENGEHSVNHGQVPVDNGDISPQITETSARDLREHYVQDVQEIEDFNVQQHVGGDVNGSNEPSDLGSNDKVDIPEVSSPKRSKVKSPASTKPPRPNKSAAPLPGTAVVAAPDEAPDTYTVLLKRMMDLGIVEEVAEPYLQSRPELGQGAVELFQRLQRMGVNCSRDHVAETADLVRWQLILWPTRPQSRQGHFSSEGGHAPGTREGALRTAIWGSKKTPGDWAPEKWWLDKMLSASEQKKPIELPDGHLEARKFFNSLTQAQRQRFEYDFKNAHGIGTINLRDIEIHTAWVADLNAPDTRAWLQGLDDNDAPPVEDGEESDDVADVQLTGDALNLYVNTLLEQIESGELEFGDIDEERRSYPLLTPDEWNEVKARVVEARRKVA
jgi:hypothetical protein